MKNSVSVREISAIGLFCGSLIAFNWLWLRLDQTPIGWDWAVHTKEAIWQAHILKNAATLGKGLSTAYLGKNGYYPPLFHFLAGLAALIGGESLDVLSMGGVPCIAVMAWGFVVLARSFRAPQGTALLSAVLCFSFPLVLDFSRTMMTDFTLASFAFCGIAYAFHPKLFRSLPLTLGIGVLFGFGMLAKWVFVFFVTPFFLIRGLLELRTHGWKRVAAHGFLLAALTLAMIGKWYWTWKENLAPGGNAAQRHMPASLGTLLGRINLSDLFSFYQYLFNANIALLVLMGLFFGGFLLRGFREKDEELRKLLLLFTVGSAIQWALWYGMVPDRVYRSYLPLVSLGAFALTYGALSLAKEKKAAFALLRYFPSGAILLTIAFHWGVYLWLLRGGLGIGDSPWIGLSSTNHTALAARHIGPDRRNWPLTQAISDALADHRKLHPDAPPNPEEPRFSFYPPGEDEIRFDSQALSYYTNVTGGIYAMGEPHYLVCTHSCQKPMSQFFRDYFFASPPSLELVKTYAVPEMEGSESHELQLLRVNVAKH